MIDPQRRWSRHADGKPDYAGLLTFAGLPYTEDLADLAGVDAAIIGAPMDELVTDRPGTRFGPRAIRAAGAPHGVRSDVTRTLREDWPTTGAETAHAIAETRATVTRARSRSMVFLLENLSGPDDIRHTGDHRLGNIVLRIFATTVKLGSTTLAISYSAAWPMKSCAPRSVIP